MCLDFLVCAFVVLGISISTVELGVGLSANLGVAVLPRFIIRNILLLKLLGIFSLRARNNPIFFKKDFFTTDFLSLSIPFNSLTYLLYFSSASCNDKFYSCISLKKIRRNEYSLKLYIFLNFCFIAQLI